MTDREHLQEALDRAHAGGPDRHREKAAEQGKLPVRERIERLLDGDSFVEEALLANWEQDGLGADGVVTGLGRVAGRPVAVMANDPTVKAGSWGPKTVEKILRIQERRCAACPMSTSSTRGRADHRPGEMFPGAAAPGGSSTTRCSSPASCRRSASCSARARPAARTSRPSATS
jgi:hypothetical protein